MKKLTYLIIVNVRIYRRQADHLLDAALSAVLVPVQSVPNRKEIHGPHYQVDLSIRVDLKYETYLPSKRRVSSVEIAHIVRRGKDTFDVI